MPNGAHGSLWQAEVVRLRWRREQGLDFDGTSRMDSRIHTALLVPLTDAGCVQFPQTVLSRLGLHWPGFRKVRRLVRKRLGRRLRISDLRAYVPCLENPRDEWDTVDALCRIPISRFYRDRRSKCGARRMSLD